MIQLNYPEMMHDIKLSIFTADQSAIYSLACSVACIAASFALISWYNHLMNDPYARLDMTSIVRAMAILFLTCNFFHMVMVPLDFVMHTVTKAITVSVDTDKDGLWGKVNELYTDAEEARRQETLVGQFEEEMESQQSETSIEGGLSAQSSAIVESLAEATVNSGESPGFFKRLWAGMKGFVSAKCGQLLDNAGSILSYILSVIVKLAQYILIAVSSVCLIILGLMGPFVFALALLPGFESGIKTWLARYIQISFWVPLTALVDLVNIKLKGAMATALVGSTIVPRMAAPFHLLILDLITLVCLIEVPTLAGWLLQSSGAEDLSRKTINLGKKAISMAKHV